MNIPKQDLGATTGSSPGYRGTRSYLDGPYHYCARCGSRIHISEMEWQRGLLLCQKYDCIDKGTYPLIGQREGAIASALQVPTDELQPDPKLMEPTSSASSVEDDIIF